jgi:sigma-54 dependent transcriptional regulator, flagellar regulatory protein
MEISMGQVAIVQENFAGTDEFIVGASPAIRAVKAMVGRVARSSASVMITGPSGAGKEVVARAIHNASDRRDGPFVAINCGAIPAELIESELFGHERGSFTGANARRIGRIEEAHGGTLFLDEIGDMRFDMQVKLLRVLEDGIISRIGGTGSVAADVRVISATHQDLDLAIADNRFREDLYFRLGVVMLDIPTLASRTEDIPSLVAHFEKKSHARVPLRFRPDGLQRLMVHDWPGNVRELRNFVERAGVLCSGETLGRFDVERLLGQSIRSPRTTAAVDPRLAPSVESTPVPALRRPALDRRPINLKEILETMELERIQMALDMSDGVISEAARMLTLKRTTLIEKMRKYGVDRAC